MNDETIKDKMINYFDSQGINWKLQNAMTIFKGGIEQGKSDAIKLIDEELLIIYNTLQKGMRDCFEWEDGFIAGEETESFIRQLREWLNSLT